MPLRKRPPRLPRPKRGGCAPGADATPCSCLSKSALQRIARAINRAAKQKRRPPVIPSVSTQTPCGLHRMIRAHYNRAPERDWPGFAGRLARAALRPRKDTLHPYLLTTNDHIRVLEQYEAVFPELEVLGALPADFCAVSYGREVCGLDLAQVLRAGKRCVAVVFNTDPSTKAGKHWVALWVDLRGPEQSTVAYLDSEGRPPQPGVRALMDRLHAQAVAIHAREPGRIPPPRPDGPLVVVRPDRPHQIKGAECGVYCVYFIELLLRGVAPERLSGEHGRITNAQMKAFFRHELFPDSKKGM